MSERDKIVSAKSRLAAAHDHSAPANAERRRQKVARGFRPNEHMERILELREQDPEAHARLSVRTRTAAGHYELVKQAAQPELLRDELAKRAALADELGYGDDWSDRDMRQNEAAYAQRFPEALPGDLANRPLGQKAE